MDALEDLWDLIVHLFVYPAFANQRIYWLYLASALALAGAVYLVERAGRRGRSGLADFARFCFPRHVFLHASALVDYAYFLVGRIVLVALVAPLILSSVAASAWTVGLLHALAGPGPGLSAGPADKVLLTAVAFIAFDLGFFIAHYLLHKVPLLWEFHKVHHSAEVLTPMTVYRTHPVDDLLTAASAGALTGLVHGTFSYLHGAGLGEITVFKLNALLFLFYIAGYNLRHSHIWLAYPGWLSHVLVSPAQHQVHHSSDPKHFDKNIGFMFALWDWLAGTLYVPRGRERLAFGLHGGEHREFDSVWRLYTLPLFKAAALLRGRGRQRA